VANSMLLELSTHRRRWHMDLGGPGWTGWTGWTEWTLWTAWTKASL